LAKLDEYHIECRHVYFGLYSLQQLEHPQHFNYRYECLVHKLANKCQARLDLLSE